MTSNNIQIKSHIIFFSDIHHFSQIYGALKEEALEFIQDVFEMMGELIVMNEGEIWKYEGDSVFALFPAHKEEKVISGAIEMRKSYQDLLKKYQIITESDLEIGIGSGEIAVGILGHKSLRMKGAYGFAVWNTAMLMHHRGIAVTQEVYEKVKDQFETRRLPDVEVKWQDERLACWEIVE